MAKVLQINLNHCLVAQDLLFQLVREEKADLVIISEEYRDLSVPNWVRDSTGTAAIWICGDLPVSNKMSDPLPGFTWVEVAGMRIYSCYLPPSHSIVEFRGSLDAIVASARSSRLPVVIGGDFNAWATEWGSVKTNRRGCILLEAFAILELVVANRGTTPTYRKGNKTSRVDLTFVDPRLMGVGLNWRVSNRYTGSDHQALLYQLQFARGTAGTTNRVRREGWAPATFNHEVFLCWLEGVAVEGTAEEKAQDLSRAITAACDVSMAWKNNRRGRQPVYWWNEDIAEIRRECLRARRRYQRARGPRQDQLRVAYEEKRKQLKTTIKAAKRKSWQDFCEEVDRDPWGRPYKAVMQKIKPRGTSVSSDPAFLDKVVRHLFPEHRLRAAGTGLTVVDDTVDLPEVTVAELRMAAMKISIRKAPGPDGVPGLAIRTAALNVPEMFRETFNACLREGIFPAVWKVQRLVLLAKGNKPLDEPSSYRPLCLLDIAGKLFERILCSRLTAAIEHQGGFSDSQFGFRMGRSTIDAINRVLEIARNAITGSRCTKRMCAIIALDIRNAFNSARWDIIMLALEEFRVPFYLRRVISSYLSDRTLIYDNAEGARSCNITGGVPQGSVLGPLLWNVLYDGLLRVPLPGGVSMVAFADDVALVVVAKTIQEVQHVGEDSIEIVANWLSGVGLSLAGDKTEAVLISRTKKRMYATFTVGNVSIQSSDTIRYLGVTLDARLSFKEHFLMAGSKASNVARALAGIMPNIGGPKQPRRSLLASVVSSVVLYGAPVWADAICSKASYGASCRRACRTAALRVARAYSTVSNIALSVISGWPPLDLLATERAVKYRESRRTDECLREGPCRWSRDTMEEWQSRWNSANEGRWTHRVIPNVIEWVSRKHGFVNFQLTQVLSGHGCFRTYLHRIQVYESAECPSCPGSDEDVEHVLFHCPRFGDERVRFQTFWKGHLSPEGLGRCMLTSQKGWDVATTLATSIVDSLNSIRRVEERSGRTTITPAVPTA